MTQIRVLFFAIAEDESCGAWFDRWINANALEESIKSICRENGCDYSITTETRNVRYD
jgi:hypothetical protein